MAEEQNNISERNLVFFDLETTGLAHTSDITQIAAICGDKIFDRYILPKQPIEPGASAVTGLTVISDTLYYGGQPVQTVSLATALTDFFNFIKTFQRPILLGHNIENFDVPVLYNSLESLSMVEEFESTLTGFVDTLKCARMKIFNVENYKQETLVRRFVGEAYDAHNAIGDVTALQKLYFAKLELTPLEMSAALFH